MVFVFVSCLLFAFQKCLLITFVAYHLKKNKRNFKRTPKKLVLNMLDILEYYISFCLNVRFALLSLSCAVISCFVLMLFGFYFDDLVILNMFI